MNGIIVLLNSFNSKNLKYEIRAKKSEKIRVKKLDEDAMLVTPCGQTDVGSSQKTFLGFTRTSKRPH